MIWTTMVTDDTAQLDPVRLDPPRPDQATRRARRRTEPSPVFVDTSGRRQRRVRRIGWLLAVPAAGYLALLASSLLGGPTIDAPFLPQAPAAQAPTSPSDAAPGGADGSAEQPDPGTAAPSAARPTGTATTRRPSGTTGATNPAATEAPTTATTGPTAPGRPTAGNTHKPTKAP